MADYFCFNNEPKEHFMPLRFKDIKHHQQNDEFIMQMIAYPNIIVKTKYLHGGGSKLKLHVNNNKTRMLEALQKRTINWCHYVLCHPGQKKHGRNHRTTFMVAQNERTNQVSCQDLKCLSKSKKKTFEAWVITPLSGWRYALEKICIEIIGPYEIKRKEKLDLVLKAVTIIDPATGWFEINLCGDKRSDTVANMKEQEWFTRYPCTSEVTCDGGSESIGQEFKDVIKNGYGLKRKLITTRNPQENEIAEKIHQALANMVRTF